MEEVFLSYWSKRKAKLHCQDKNKGGKEHQTVFPGFKALLPGFYYSIHTISSHFMLTRVSLPWSDQNKHKQTAHIKEKSEGNIRQKTKTNKTNKTKKLTKEIKHIVSMKGN